MPTSKTILVTGASRGIGYLTAKLLAEGGHTVFAGMRDIEDRNAASANALRTFARSGQHSLEPIEMDVTDETSVQSAVTLIEKKGPIDVLINNAGTMPVGITEAYSPDDILACFDLNLLGVARVCRAVLPQMRKRREGYLLHVSSNAGRLALPFFGLYCASKWALEAYAESMHYELENFDINTTILEPGGHATDLVKNPPMPSDQECVASYGKVANGPASLVDMFQGVFAEGNDVNDPVNIARKIASLIAMGTPPLRVTVGDDMGVSLMNEQIRSTQEGVISALKPMVTFNAD